MIKFIKVVFRVLIVMYQNRYLLFSKEIQEIVINVADGKLVSVTSKWYEK